MKKNTLYAIALGTLFGSCANNNYDNNQKTYTKPKVKIATVYEGIPGAINAVFVDSPQNVIKAKMTYVVDTVVDVNEIRYAGFIDRECLSADGDTIVEKDTRGFFVVPKDNKTIDNKIKK